MGIPPKIRYPAPCASQHGGGNPAESPFFLLNSLPRYSEGGPVTFFYIMHPQLGLRGRLRSYINCGLRYRFCLATM